MNLEQATQLYATVLRQLLPVGGYDTAPNTVVAADVYAHAKVLAQADLDAKRLLKVLEGIPTELLSEYEYEYGLPLKCTVNATKSIEERLQILNWFKNTENVFNRAYLKQLLAIFGIELFELLTYRPIQCTAPCTAPVNTEQLRYKVRIVIPAPVPADIQCIIENYLPAYLRVDVLTVSTLYSTSKPYPYYFTEGVQTTFGVNDLTLRTIMNETALSENIQPSFNVNAQIIKEIIYRSASLETENLQSSFAITSAQITKEIIYRSTSAATESIQPSFAVTNAQITKEVAYISLSTQVEACSASFTISAQIIEET